MKPPAAAWDRLAELAEYPSDPSYARIVDACIDAAAPYGAAAPLAPFRERVSEGGLDSMRERYVEAFDFDPACALDMSWHVAGDAPERGTLLTALRQDLARVAVDERGELPDHLPVLLRLVAREDAARASALAACIAPALAGVRDRLAARNNPYAGVIDTIERMLAALQREEEHS